MALNRDVKREAVDLSLDHDDDEVQIVESRPRKRNREVAGVIDLTDD